MATIFIGTLTVDKCQPVVLERLPSSPQTLYIYSNLKSIQIGFGCQKRQRKSCQRARMVPMIPLFLQTPYFSLSKSDIGRIRSFRGLTTGLFSRFFTVFYLISIIAKKWWIESKRQNLFKAFSDSSPDERSGLDGIRKSRPRAYHTSIPWRLYQLFAQLNRIRDLCARIEAILSSGNKRLSEFCTRDVRRGSSPFRKTMWVVRTISGGNGETTPPSLKR